MLIFADENVPTLVVEGLRAAGHNVTWGCEYGHGLSDAARLADAYLENRIVVTEDNDFAQLIMTGKQPAHGLIRFDLPGMGRVSKATRILNAIVEIGAGAAGHMVVIEATRIRSHLLP